MSPFGMYEEISNETPFCFVLVAYIIMLKTYCPVTIGLQFSNFSKAQRKINFKCCSFANLAFYLNLSVVALNYSLGQRKTDTDAFGRGILSAVEAFKNVPEILLVHSAAVVGYLYHAEKSGAF